MRGVPRAGAWSVFLSAIGIAAAFAGAVEPDAPKRQSPDRMKDFEGLGFSVAPRGGGKARIQLFGLVGEGYKFVYVFDRSASMGGSGRTSLAAVKAELTESLKPLDTVQQFQIIFYNERPLLFNPSGIDGKLAFGTEQNKERALRFLETVEPGGGTDHELALRAAIGLRPDVIFFLTDGDEPQLKTNQLDRIERLAAGVVIHTIEFGSGPKTTARNFLAELAERTGGESTYVDISQLGAKTRQK